MIITLRFLSKSFIRFPSNSQIGILLSQISNLMSFWFALFDKQDNSTIPLTPLTYVHSF